MNRVIVGLLSFLSLLLRVVPLWGTVFQAGFVNFLESDAWLHVRTVENLVHHFPFRMRVDPYATIGRHEGVPTGPLYDWLLGLVALIAGFGHPSERLLHIIAAWYPAVLAALIVPVAYLLAKELFSARAGLIAAAVVATLPGHMLRVSFLGYTDHHVLEALLSGLVMWTLIRVIEEPSSNPRAAAAGIVLAAYLLAFVGGAFFVAIILVWVAADRILTWKSTSWIYIVLFLAAALVAPFRQVLWMDFSLTALLLGALAIGAIDLGILLASRTQSPRFVFFSSVVVFALVAAAAAYRLNPGRVRWMLGMLSFLSPRGETGIAELNPLYRGAGHLSLMPLLREFGGVALAAIAGAILLLTDLRRRISSQLLLLLIWAGATFVLTLGQTRMGVYFAVPGAILTAVLFMRGFELKGPVRWTVVAGFVAAIMIPGIVLGQLVADTLHGVAPDWKEAMTWLRQNSPEPFGDPNVYYARNERGFEDPPQAYSVMSWWDFGYWISAIGHRAPVSNPTQRNAEVSARFFLAQSEEEALTILDRYRSKYIVVDGHFPFLGEGAEAMGIYTAFFFWDHTKLASDYLMLVDEPQLNGPPLARFFYKPNYYRSMAVRLFVFGGREVAEAGNAAVVSVEPNAATGHMQVTNIQRFPTINEARRAERRCAGQGCMLVGASPIVSCVPLEPLLKIRQVFSSSTALLKEAGTNIRSAVQIFER